MIPDSKLEKALKEALIDHVKDKGNLLDEQFRGVTKDGYTIEGYWKNGKPDTFYFL